MIYILYGEDDFSREKTVKAIKDQFGDPTLLAANMSVLEGKDVTPEALRAVCEAMPFLADKRLVIVRGLLERFESTNRTGRSPKKSKRKIENNDHTSFAKCIPGLSGSTVLVLEDGPIGSKNPLLRELSGKAEVRYFPLLKDVMLRQWVLQYVSRQGSTISPQALALLVRFVGSNLRVMSGEIDKLALYASGRRIEEDDIREVVSLTQETSVFAMTDAILESRAAAAGQLLQQLLQQGASPSYLLLMLLRQIEMLVRAKDLREQGKPDAEIQSKLGLVSDFALRRVLARTTKYSFARVREIYHQLLEADLSIKTGKYNDELALSILIADLCR